MQRLAGMNQRMDGVRCHRGFGEALQDEFQLAGIGGDVADGENAGAVGGAGGGGHGDMIAL